MSGALGSWKKRREKLRRYLLNRKDGRIPTKISRKKYWRAMYEYCDASDQVAEHGSRLLRTKNAAARSYRKGGWDG